MTQPSKSPNQEPYLSTEDIVERVRTAQGKNRVLSLRGPYIPLGCFVVILALGLVLYNANRKRGHDASVSDAVSQNMGSVASEPTGPQISEPSGRTESALPAIKKAAPVKVSVVGRASIITLDGRRLTVDRRWSGQVPFGRHTLGVRCGGTTLRRRIAIEADSIVNLSFDCEKRRVEQW